MLSGLQHFATEAHVHVGGQADIDQIDVFVADDLIDVRIALDVGQRGDGRHRLPLDIAGRLHLSRQTIRIAVADRGNL